MEWLAKDSNDKLRRKYSNETMRKLKVYIDEKKLKDKYEGYNDTLDRINEPKLKNSRLRTLDELSEDIIFVKGLN